MDFPSEMKQKMDGDAFQVVTEQDKQRIKEIAQAWLDRPKAQAKPQVNDTVLPSRFQIGDEVIIKAKVKAVQFAGGKVSYCFWLDDKLHTITSDHVRPADE